MNSARHRDMIDMLGVNGAEFRGVRFRNFGPQPFTDGIGTFKDNVWLAGETTHAMLTFAPQLQSGTGACEM